MDKIQQIASSFRVFSKIIEKRSNFLSNLQKPNPKNIPIFQQSNSLSTPFFVLIGFALIFLVIFVFKENESAIWLQNLVQEWWDKKQTKTLAETFIRGNTVVYRSPDDIKELLSL